MLSRLDSFLDVFMSTGDGAMRVTLLWANVYLYAMIYFSREAAVKGEGSWVNVLKVLLTSLPLIFLPYLARLKGGLLDPGVLTGELKLIGLPGEIRLQGSLGSLFYLVLFTLLLLNKLRINFTVKRSGETFVSRPPASRKEAAAENFLKLFLNEKRGGFVKEREKLVD